MQDELKKALSEFRPKLAMLGRTGRWGTCTDCPQAGDGTLLPELCVNTDRQDHRMTMDDLARLWDGHPALSPSLEEHCDPAPPLEFEVSRTPRPRHQQEHQDTQPARIRRQKAKALADGSKKETLAELLDGIDSVFEALKMPPIKQSWLKKDTALALRKMGVHVPNPWVMPLACSLSDIQVGISDRVFPHLMSINLAYNRSTATDSRMKDVVPAQMAFAVRENKLPWNVTRHPGVPYMFGCAYKDPDSNKDLFWAYMWVVVNEETGHVSVCNELRSQRFNIPVKSPSQKKRFGSHISVKRTLWSSPRFLEDMGSAKTQEEYEVFMLSLFASMFDWWKTRKNKWNVAVKDSKDRITFSIEPSDTKVYFADRDKTIRTPTGQAAKIIHFVREHERVRNDKPTTVREHVRGLREFDWHGYHCLVTAPSLTGNVLTSVFDSSPRYDTPDEVCMDLVETAEFLATKEDRDLRPGRDNT